MRPQAEVAQAPHRFGRALQTLLTNLPEGLVPSQFEEMGYGMVVADGMGGRAAGEIASQMAISTLVALALDTPDWILGESKPETDRVLQRMKERYQRVDAVYRGDQVGPGRKSIAFSVAFQSTERTLSDEDAAALRQKIVEALEKKYGSLARVWVLDRGMVSEANLKYLRERGSQYIVGTPTQWVTRSEAIAASSAAVFPEIMGQ